jgi:hypothetical protein
VNTGILIDKELYSDLEWLKKLRNNIEHFTFDMNVKEVRTVLGRLLRAADDFVGATGLPPLAPDIAGDCSETFEQLRDEYREHLANARADAKEGAGEGDPTYCSYCGEQDVAYLSEDKLVCAFCEEAETLNDCVVCGGTYRRSEVSVWNDEHEGGTDYACMSCEDRIFSGD